MVTDRFFVLTGAFGSGKSTVLENLQLRGIRAIMEPARPILAEQRSMEGRGLPEKDPRLFVELMLSRMLDAYRQSDTLPGPVLFDRGIPDILGYAELFGLDFPHYESAAHVYRYNPQVFMALPGSRYTARMTSALCRFPWRATLAITFEPSMSD